MTLDPDPDRIQCVACSFRTCHQSVQATHESARSYQKHKFKIGELIMTDTNMNLSKTSSIIVGQGNIKSWMY